MTIYAAVSMCPCNMDINMNVNRNMNKNMISGISYQ
jgi:hypothetical protein